MGFVKNEAQVLDGITLLMKKVEAAPILAFRQLVWQIFYEILQQTPQWSGKAVANWNIGIGAPDYSWDDDVGEKVDLWATNALQKGDNEWIAYALFRNHDKVWKDLKRREKVFITNSVWGDDDDGRADTNHYLVALQDPAYWQEKLRAVNRPYEVVDETVIRVMRDYKRGVGLSISSMRGDSFGGVGE
jgi:hypothetical protein